MNPETLAALARMANREAEAQVTTGEPCVCPEHVVKCVCGAYR
jgi:hypothetical protein